MAKADVLIAEDDAVLRNLYGKKFSAAGFALRTAESGQTAIAAIQQKSPDILLLDVNMPDGTGFDVLRTFPPERRTFPVIMLTNFMDADTKQRAEELGANAFFLKKDMTIRTLLQSVETLIAERRGGN